MSVLCFQICLASFWLIDSKYVAYDIIRFIMLRISKPMKDVCDYVMHSPYHVFFFFFFFIQFNVPFKIISLIETSQSVGGAKREYPGKTT